MSFLTSCCSHYTFEEREQSLRHKEYIILKRGTFKWMPVYFANDLVHGSWWYVWGSIFATVIPIVPLIEISWDTGYWEAHDQ